MWDGSSEVVARIGSSSASRQTFQGVKMGYKLYEVGDGLVLHPVHKGVHDSRRIFKDFLDVPKDDEKPMVIIMGPREIIEKLAEKNVPTPICQEGPFMGELISY